MLSKILTLQGVKKITKQQANNINGAIDQCLSNCFQDFVDCREISPFPAYCFEDLQICRNYC